MKKLLIILSLTLPLFAQAAVTAGSTATATSTTGQNAVNMLTQLPAFLTKLETLRGQALTATEKTSVTNVVTKGNNTATEAQSQFLSGVSKATGLDTATLGVMFPSATKTVSNADLTSKVESKMGTKLNFLQKSGLTAANTMRTDTLDSLKTTVTNGVAKKMGMDPAVVSSLMPLLGF